MTQHLPLTTMMTESISLPLVLILLFLTSCRKENPSLEVVERLSDDKQLIILENISEQSEVLEEIRRKIGAYPFFERIQVLPLQSEKLPATNGFAVLNLVNEANVQKLTDIVKSSVTEENVYLSVYLEGKALDDPRNIRAFLISCEKIVEVNPFELNVTNNKK